MRIAVALQRRTLCRVNSPRQPSSQGQDLSVLRPTPRESPLSYVRRLQQIGAVSPAETDHLEHDVCPQSSCTVSSPITLASVRNTSLFLFAKD